MIGGIIVGGVAGFAMGWLPPVQYAAVKATGNGFILIELPFITAAIGAVVGAVYIPNVALKF